jgi:hypothetical protein
VTRRVKGSVLGRMEALFNKTLETAKSVSAAALSRAENASAAALTHASSAKEFVVERAQMAKLKVSGHIWGVSEDPFEELDTVTLEKGRFIVEIIEATDVPRCDMFSESDPFVEVYIFYKAHNKTKGIRISQNSVSPIKVDTNNPVWHYHTNLSIIPPPGSYLKINLYDSDFDDNAVLKSKTLLGHVEIPVEELSTEKELICPFTFNKHGNPTQNPNFAIKLRRAFLETPPPSLVTFFIIRHGESKWNRAEDKKDIPALLAFDHALTDTGIYQVILLPCPVACSCLTRPRGSNRRPRFATNGRGRTRPSCPRWPFETTGRTPRCSSRTRIWRPRRSTRSGFSQSTSSCS